MTTAITGDDGTRVHITLGPQATTTARSLAHRDGIDIPELVRRSLGLYRMWVNLDPGEELMVRRKDGSLVRIGNDTDD